MTTMTVDIINPKAANILKDLADLNLISIRENSKKGFAAILEKLRKDADLAPSLDEITKEVKLVRAKRYAK